LRASRLYTDGGTEIHGPVPGYETKLEKSMDRYFASMPFGKLIWRSNWSISTDGALFNLGSSGQHSDVQRHTEDDVHQKRAMAPSHYEPTAKELASWKEESKSIDVAKCGLRMERQTLHRLEKSGALIFGFKTILEPLSEIKKEGSGAQLAEALNGLRRGNVPAMDVYKNAMVWREAVVEYLVG